MSTEHKGKVAFACAYTPLALIDAAGFTPVRILPMSEAPDRAGQLLHDNLCPHVKRILDRALDDDLPDLDGVVFMNSCDAMRRLCDAWRQARPDDRVALVDLPVEGGELAAGFLSGELGALAATLADWGGQAYDEGRLAGSIQNYNTLAGLLQSLIERLNAGRLAGGAKDLQQCVNELSAMSALEGIEKLKVIAAEKEKEPLPGVPVYLFGNVLPELQAFELFESCGARIADFDLCTGARLIQPIEPGGDGDLITRYARGLLSRRPCARTLYPDKPGYLAELVLEGARGCGARAVIGHTLKFCDPYLSRMPMIRQRLKEEKLPLLVLEGDCTLRSIGQHRTRIEAFVEMME